jgi:hypothetical protein
LGDEERESELDKLLSPEIIVKSVRIGIEWLIPLPEVLQAIAIATSNLIAVLGVECYEILSDGVKFENYSGYQFSLSEDWTHFAQLNNEAAAAFIGANPLPEGHGYILTATSKSEYDGLSTLIGPN